MKLKIIIPIILIIIGILFLIFLPKTSDSDEIKINQITTKEEAIETVNILNDKIIKGGSKKDLIKVLGTNEIGDYNIMTGPDSYVRQSLDDKTIKKYNLENYVSKANSLADNLEEKIKTNFEVQLQEPIMSKKNVSIAVTYKTYYYQNYLTDLQKLQFKLLTLAGHKLDENTKSSDKLTVDSYKAKVKAMTILDKNLNNYVNNNETKTVGINYKNGNISGSSDSLISYFINITGYTYQANSIDSDLIKNSESRINKYLEEIDGNNPLKL